MLGWLAKRWMSQPTSEFLLGEDFETLWSLSFRWCGRQVPNSCDLAVIPEDVKEVAYRLMRGFFKKKLTLRLPDGYKAQNEPLMFFLKELNPWRKVLWRALAYGEFNVTYLSKLYLERSEVLSWCEEEQISPPAFWVKATAKEVVAKKYSLENRSKDEAVDRLVCQAIARVYWDIDPNIHPAHLAGSKAIGRYGNGNQYKDPNTVKGWIGDLDPMKDTRKPGRPPAPHYPIDLETGALAYQEAT